MHASALFAFIALEIALCIIPGPAVMAVVGAALQRQASGFATASGILTGNAIYFVTSALGVVSLIFASQTAFVVLKWAGAAYLAFLGVRAIVLPRGGAAAEAATAVDQPMFGKSWLVGTVTQLANPKAAVFFAAILPQFIDPHAPVVPQAVILGAASLAVELGVLSSYIIGVDAIRRRGISASSRALAERIGGVFLIGVAAAVLVEHA